MTDVSRGEDCHPFACDPELLRFYGRQIHRVTTATRTITAGHRRVKVLEGGYSP